MPDDGIRGEIARQGPAIAASFTRAFKEKVSRLEASIKGKMPASEKRHLAVSALAAHRRNGRGPCGCQS